MIDLATCRSLLFVPAHVQRFVEKAADRGADAIVLDLEDSVPSEQKQAARHAAAMASSALGSRGVPLFVRINGATELVKQVMGEEAGRHARTALGMAQLPLGTSVEVEMIFQLKMGPAHVLADQAISLGRL